MYSASKGLPFWEAEIKRLKLICAVQSFHQTWRIAFDISSTGSGAPEWEKENAGVGVRHDGDVFNVL